jgi:uncharacterized sodium:solute symporter family permease YidK
LLAVVAMGMLTTRVPTWAAKVALTGGVVGYFLLDWLSSQQALGFSLHWLHVAGLNTALLCAFMAAAAWMFPARPAAAPVAGAPGAIAPRSADWSGLGSTSLVVAVLAVLLYWFFWRLAS